MQRITTLNIIHSLKGASWDNSPYDEVFAAPFHAIFGPNPWNCLGFRPIWRRRYAKDYLA